jgi:hypothetical protein
VPLRAFITPDYVAKTSRRVEIYRRLSEAGSGEEVSALAEEVRDRYGPLPPEAENLFGVAGLRLACMAAGVREVSHDGDDIALRLGPGGVAVAEALTAEASREGYPWRAPRFRKNMQELVIYFEPGSWAARGREYMEGMTELLGAILAEERLTERYGSDSQGGTGPVG